MADEDFVRSRKESQKLSKEECVNEYKEKKFNFITKFLRWISVKKNKRRMTSDEDMFSSTISFINNWNVRSGVYPKGRHNRGDYYICINTGNVNGINYNNSDIIIWDGNEWDCISNRTTLSKNKVWIVRFEKEVKAEQAEKIVDAIKEYIKE